MKNLIHIDSEVQSKVIFNLSTGAESPGGHEQLKATPDKLAMTPAESFKAKKAGCEHLGQIARGQNVDTGPAVGEAIGCTDQDGRAISALGDAPESVVSAERLAHSFNQRLGGAIAAIPIPAALAEFNTDVSSMMEGLASDGDLSRVSDLKGDITDSVAGAEVVSDQLTAQEREAALTQRAEVEAALAEYLAAVVQAYQTVAAEAAAQAGDNPEAQAHAKALQLQAGVIKQVAEHLKTDGLAWEQELNLGGNEAVVAAATGELGQANNDAEGNARYTPGGKNQPWCADFANFVIEQAGGKGTGSSMAQSFVGGSGLGHVGILVGGKLLGGNQRNSVCYKPMPSEFKWNTAENISAGIYAPQEGEPPEGAFIVTSRKATDSTVS